MFFDKMREPIVLKEESFARKQIEQLNVLMASASAEVKARIEQDIRLLQCGIYGEDALMFELKNSHMAMYILHDLFFEHNGCTTQIDYLIITRKLVIVLECKNLFGDITIDNQGNFTRKIYNGNKYDKRGIYSPVTQNQRHLDMIHELRRLSKPAILRSAFDKRFDDAYKSLIVLANPNSVLDMRYAPKSVKEKVVKIDGVISSIKKLQESSEASNMSDKEMKELAEFFLSKNVIYTNDYTEKYQFTDVRVKTSDKSYERKLDDTQVSAACSNVEETPLYLALKKYRYNKSKEEGIKPYFLYNDIQLKELIKCNPSTLTELRRVSGFGDAKCSKYGNDVLEILDKYRD